MVHVIGIAGAAGLLTALYHLGVDRYAQWKVHQMQKVPALELCPNCNNSTGGAVLWTPSELRRTVSKRTGLVERLSDRCAWNQWILTTPTMDEVTILQPGSYHFMYRSNTKTDEVNSIKQALFHIPTCLGFVSSGNERIVVTGNSTTILQQPRSYHFMYRSYVKMDEGNSIKRSLFHIPTWFGFGLSGKDRIIFSPENNKVKLYGRFRNLRALTSYEITWDGTIEWQDDTSKPFIQWTGTSMTTKRFFGNKNTATTIANPPMAEKLRKVPWQILKVQDGMIGFRRGDEGLLAYSL